MLNRRNTIILFAILVVLVAASIAQRASHDRRTSRSSSEALVEGDLNGAALERIVIGRGRVAEAVVLERDAQGWRVASAWDAPASAQRVESLLNAVSGLRGEFRSDSEAVLPDFGFTDSTVVRVTGYAAGGQSAFAVEIGEKPRQGTGAFVRRPGDRRVYHSGADLLGALGVYTAAAGPQSRHFVDLQAFTCAREDVDAITLREDGRSVTLAKVFTAVEPAAGDTTGAPPSPDRASWEWRLEGAARGPAAKTRADAVLAAICNLRAQDVADPATPAAVTGLAEPTRRAVVTFADGTTRELAFGAARAAATGQPAGVYTRVDGGPLLWVVGDYQLDLLFKDPEELKPES